MPWRIFLVLLLVLAVLPGSGLGASHGRAAPPPASAAANESERTLRFDDVLDVWSEQTADSRVSGDVPLRGGTVPGRAGDTTRVAIDCEDARVLCPSEVFTADAHGTLSPASRAKLVAALDADSIGADGDTLCARATRVRVRADGTTAQSSPVHGYVSVTLPTHCLAPSVSYDTVLETTLTANFTLARSSRTDTPESIHGSQH